MGNLNDSFKEFIEGQMGYGRNKQKSKEEKPVIYGLNSLYRQIAKGFADDITSDSDLGSKIKNIWLYGSVARGKPNPNDIDIYIEAEPWSDSDLPKVLEYQDKWEKNLEDKLQEENPQAFELGYAIGLNTEINKPLLLEQVIKWHEPLVRLYHSQ